MLPWSSFSQFVEIHKISCDICIVKENFTSSIFSNLLENETIIEAFSLTSMFGLLNSENCLALCKECEAIGE